jgi:hypothetical protein
VEAAYRRGDLFEKRRELMLSWEQFVALRALILFSGKSESKPALRGRHVFLI